MSDAHVTIDLSDVVAAGSVEKALIAWAKSSDTTGCGPTGPTFSTSGPGNGWSTNHGASDYATRTLTEGGLYYLDESSGRLAERDEVDLEDEECDDDGEPTDSGILCDRTDGTYFRLSWSGESVVALAVPDLDDAIEHPEVVAEMAQAVIDTHGPCSDRKGWAELIQSIKEAAEALDGIDADDLLED